MSKKALVFCLLTFLALAGCSQKPKETSSEPANLSENQPEAAIDTDSITKYRYETYVLAENLRIPWDVAVLPDSGELLFTQRGGELSKLTRDGNVITVAKLNQSAEIGEGGLTGLTLHPDFPDNRHIYLYYTYRSDGSVKNRISRFTYQNDTISDERTIVENLPGGKNHNSGRLRFGPDKKLYIETGDGEDRTTPQNLNSLGGKILRVNDDGTIPDDNPFSNSPVYSLGHRNPQGLDWHPITKQLIATEHGQEAHDEINLIEKGRNYGWPNEQECFSSDPKFTDPLFCSENNRYAPSGGAFIGDKLKGLENSFFFANLRGTSLRKIDLIDSKLVNEEVILDNIGRVRGVTQLNNDALIITTSNLDGRGTVNKNDDKIIKVVPIPIK